MSEMPRCYTEEFPTARKRHRCCECRGWIEPGERYRRFSGVWDDPATFKICPDCEELRKLVDKDVPLDECTAFGCLSESVSELGGEARSRYVEIMQKRGTKIHSSWLVPAELTMEDAGITR